MWHFFAYCIKILVKIYMRLYMNILKLKKHYNQHQIITYREVPLRAVTRHRLQLVKKKILVLDMDETLIHSCFLRRNQTIIDLPTNTPYDFTFRMQQRRCSVYVYKRPHLDLFLETISKWYKLCIYTSAKEDYANEILNRLDNKDRKILTRRYFRNDCIDINGKRLKLLNKISKDLANIFILDDSKNVCILNGNNSVHIKAFNTNQKDIELLKLLPFLEALRFCKDVRNILKGANYINL